MFKLHKLFICLSFSMLVFANDVSEKFFQGMDKFNSGNYKKSIKIFKNILKKHKTYYDLGKIQNQIALAYEKLGKFQKAYEAYEIIFEKYKDFKNIDEVVRREYDIALKFYNYEIKSLLGVDETGSRKLALTIFNQVLSHAPFSDVGEKSLLKIIEIYLDHKDFKSMYEKISFFRKNYEKSSFLDDVLYYEGYGYYVRRKSVGYDQSKTETAILKFKDYLSYYPDGKYLDKVQTYLEVLFESVSEQTFKIANYYLKKGDNDAADKYFNYILKNFPDTSWAKMISKRIDILQN